MEIINPVTPKRPTFLTVLCILTFIGSGLTLFNNIMGMIISPIFDLFQPMAFSKILSEIQDPIAMQFVSQALSIAQEAMNHAFEIALTNSLLYALSLAGAILMFKLNKNGYYLYVIAQIAILFVPAIFLGFNIIVNLGIAMGSFMTIIFIILYSLNLKHLK